MPSWADGDVGLCIDAYICKYSRSDLNVWTLYTQRGHFEYFVQHITNFDNDQVTGKYMCLHE